MKNKQKDESNEISHFVKQHLGIIVIFGILIIAIAIMSLFTWSLFCQISKTNLNIMTMQNKIDRFVYYLHHKYDPPHDKNSKLQNKQIKQAGPTSTLTSIFNKFTSSSKPDEPPHYISSTLKSSDNKSSNLKTTKQMSRKHKHSSNIHQLLSQEEIIGMAVKIIEQDSNQQINGESQNSQTKLQMPSGDQQKHVLANNLQETQNHAFTLENFQFSINPHSKFYRNFQFNDKQLTLKKTIFTYQNQPLVSWNALPKSLSKTFQLTIKIKQTLKGWIYIGMVGYQQGRQEKAARDLGIQSFLDKTTSLHLLPNFYGYSGYSGRIWQKGIPKQNFHSEIFKNKDIFKIRYNFLDNTMEYWLNDQQLGESKIQNFDCKDDSIECRFAIQMYNNEDQVQFLRPYIFEEPNLILTQQEKEHVQLILEEM